VNQVHRVYTLLAMRWLLTLIVAVGLRGVGAADPPLLAELLNRTGEQVRRFEQDFTLVISEENYRQHANGQVIGLRQRRTRAEMLFLWLPEERVWLTVRNVLIADGHPVAGSEGRFDSALHATGADRLARLRQVINDNARFNVGRTYRNFNYPTLVLSFLDPAIQPRFKFSLAGRERIRGVDAWKINYEERGSPTVIQGDGADLTSRGAVWVVAQSGAVVRTQLAITMSPAAWATVEVDYQQNSKLAMWVPAAMHETYMDMLGTVVHERVGGEATYSAFRRFETSGRVVVP
jgi:hypothetical protein